MDPVTKCAAVKFAAGEDLTADESRALRVFLSDAAVGLKVIKNAVIKGLSSEDPAIRIRTAQELASPEGDQLPLEVLSKLQDLVVSDDDPDVRRVAMNTLLTRSN